MTDKIKKILPKISEAFKKLNTDKLTPIHEHFKGEYTYDEIRIVRILLPRN